MIKFFLDRIKAIKTKVAQPTRSGESKTGTFPNSSQADHKFNHPHIETKDESNQIKHVAVPDPKIMKSIVGQINSDAKTLLDTRIYTGAVGIVTSFKRIIISIAKVLVVIVTVVASLIIIYDFFYNETYPFFEYSYRDGIFVVESDKPNVSITDVKWKVPSKALRESGNWQLRQINSHPEFLGFYDLVDYLHLEIKTLSREKIEGCLQFISDPGVPALVTVTYDKNRQKDLKTEDFVLIKKLDTSIPVVYEDSRNITEKNIPILFNQYIPWLSSSLNVISDQSFGCADFISDQPMEGYIKPEWQSPFKK